MKLGENTEWMVLTNDKVKRSGVRSMEEKREKEKKGNREERRERRER